MPRARMLLTVAAVVGSLTAPAVLAGPALAATTGIPLDGAADLVAVPTAAPTHLVIAGSPPGTTADGRYGAVVTGLDGSDPVTVPNLTHVTSLAVGPDGSTVYAASHDNAIASFSADSPNADIIDTGTAFGCPYDLAVASDGLVWFSYGCTPDNQGIAVLDTTTDDITAVATGPLAGGLAFPVQVQNAAAAPDTMVAAAIGGDAHLFTVDGTAETDLGTVTGPVQSVQFDAAGDKLFLGRSNYYELQRFSVSSTPGYEASYSMPSPSAIGSATSADGSYVAAAGAGSFTAYGPASTLATRTYTPGSGNQAALRGAVWAGHTLITMTHDSTGQPTVHGHSDATYLPTSLTVSTPAKGKVNEAFTLSGRLTARGTGLSHKSLTVSRTDGNGTKVVGTPTTSSDGSYQLRVTPPNGEYVTYTVKYAGNDGYQPTKAAHKLWVDRLSTFLSIHTNYDAYWYHHTAQITVHLGTTYRSRWVTVYANEAGVGKSKIAGGYVDGDGKFTTAFRMRYNTTFSAEFKGDLRRAPATASHFVHTAVIPTLTLKGYYGTDKDGNRLYHKSQWIHQSAHVDPNKAGQCVYFDVQYKKDGKWHDMGSTPCFPLGPGSNSEAWFNTPGYGVVGRVYRFGFYWKGDAYNLGAGSLWRYAKVTA